MLNTLAGIIASSGGAAAGGSYESIATVTVGAGGASTVTFTSIPSTYQHLQIRMLARSNRAVTLEGAHGYFNSDTTLTNYRIHGLLGNGASASAYDDSSNYTYIGLVSGASAGASMFGVSVCDILDYANTSKNKTVRSLSGSDQNGSGQSRLNGSVWLSTAAINAITISTNGGGNWVEYTQFALYGIKG